MGRPAHSVGVQIGAATGEAAWRVLIKQSGATTEPSSPFLEMHPKERTEQQNQTHKINEKGLLDVSKTYIIKSIFINFTKNSYNISCAKCKFSL